MVAQFRKLWTVTLETNTRQFTEDVIADSYDKAAELCKGYRESYYKEKYFVKEVKYKQLVLVEVQDAPNGNSNTSNNQQGR